MVKLRRAAGAGERLDISVRDLTRLRQTFERSLGALPAELRFDIARRLLAADSGE